MTSNRPPTLADLFGQLPAPAVEIIRKADALMSSEVFLQWLPFLTKLVEFSVIYILIMLNLGYGWVLFLVTIAYYKREAFSSQYFEIYQSCTTKSEEAVLKDSMQSYPSWVVFPDFDRVEWINEILKQLWPNLDSYATFFVRSFLEPKIKEILDRMNLENASRFSVKKVMLGSIPARLGGIKVYEAHRKSKDEIVLDAEVVYSGDARVQFTLQGIGAEINKIKFKGNARITLKPLLSTFPFIGGFELYFLNTPTIEYGLGGIGTFGDLPGISAIVKSVVMSNIRSRFVWPNRISIYLPLEKFPDVKMPSDKTFMMRRPSGLLTIDLPEARDLVKKDNYVLGSGKSDPYAVVAIGRQKFNFRDQYVPKTVNPTWNYRCQFLLEDWSGQVVTITIYDYDKADTDDFMGRVEIKLKDLLGTEEHNRDAWIKLNEVPHGDIRVVSNWREAYDVEDADEVQDSYIISFFVDTCENLDSLFGDNVYPRVRVWLNNKTKGDEVVQTSIKNKSANPSFQEGFLLQSNSPREDVVHIEVVDTKGGKGGVHRTLRVEDIVHSPGREIMEVEVPLEREASIKLSAKLYACS